jgi:predicted amidohydrolase
MIQTRAGLCIVSEEREAGGQAVQTTLQVELLAWDVSPNGAAAASADDYLECLIGRVEQSLEEGAELVLLPEFCWLGVQGLLTGGGLRQVADWFWQEAAQRLQERLGRPGVCVVLGTVPFWDAASGTLRNRAPILRDGSWLHQDKLHLTPWEQGLVGGDGLHLFQVKSFWVAVVICLDIEVPELAVALRDRGVDLLLCPSATETLLGVERVDRCASARAVELGCYVGVCHLLGAAEGADLIDANVGRVAVYRPSQVPFAGEARMQEGDVMSAGRARLRFAVNSAALRRMRARQKETNPCLLSRRAEVKVPPVIIVTATQ